MRPDLGVPQLSTGSIDEEHVRYLGACVARGGGGQRSDSAGPLASGFLYTHDLTNVKEKVGEGLVRRSAFV